MFDPVLETTRSELETKRNKLISLGTQMYFDAFPMEHLSDPHEWRRKKFSTRQLPWKPVVVQREDMFVLLEFSVENHEPQYGTVGDYIFHCKNFSRHCHFLKCWVLCLHPIHGHIDSLILICGLHDSLLHYIEERS
jgi:hypothetical protein